MTSKISKRTLPWVIGEIYFLSLLRGRKADKTLRFLTISAGQVSGADHWAVVAIEAPVSGPAALDNHTHDVISAGLIVGRAEALAAAEAYARKWIAAGKRREVKRCECKPIARPRRSSAHGPARPKRQRPLGRAAGAPVE